MPPFRRALRTGPRAATTPRSTSASDGPFHRTRAPKRSQARPAVPKRFRNRLRLSQMARGLLFTRPVIRPLRRPHTPFFDTRSCRCAGSPAEGRLRYPAAELRLSMSAAQGRCLAAGPAIVRAAMPVPLRRLGLLRSVLWGPCPFGIGASRRRDPVRSVTVLPSTTRRCRSGDRPTGLRETGRGRRRRNHAATQEPMGPALISPGCHIFRRPPSLSHAAPFKDCRMPTAVMP